jgi:hypothetical protein
MRDRFDNPAGYVMTFIIPAKLLGEGPGLIPLGRHQPCLHGCRLDVERGGLVRLIGPSRERVFEQVERFFRIMRRREHGRGCEPVEIPAILETPSRPGMPGGRDYCTIILSAKVSIVWGHTARLFGEEDNVVDLRAVVA